MIAETAELAVVLKLKDQLTGGLTAAESKLGMLESTASRTATGGLSRLQTVANGVGGALGHAKSQLAGLVGGLGLLAGGAGLFSVFGGLEQGVSKIETMGLAVEKLTGVTGLSVHAASQLVAVFEKFGVDAGAATTSAAFAEKTIGKLAETMTGKGAAAVSKLTALDKQYGIQLVDSKGKAVDYATELGVVADYYNSNATTASKAALAAQLLGRGYVALIPILKLGSKGIAEAAAEADKLGVTLKTAQDVTNVQKFIAAQRDAQEALGGLEEQLGLLVMPDLTVGLKAFRDFVVQDGPQIQEGFRSLLGFAEQIGGAFTNVVIPAIQEIGGVWNSLPGPIKELLIGGFLANKAVKWTFGIDVAGLAGKALGGAISNLFKNATTASMSVEAGVVNVAGGGVPGVGGAAGGTASAVEGAGGAAVAETGWAAGGLAGLAALAASVLGSAAVAAGIISVENKITGTTAQDIATANTHGQFGARTAAQGAAVAAAAARTSSSGGTGGNVGGDQYPKELRAVVDTGSAGVMARAIANGLKPTASGITATLAKDATTRAIEAAVNRTTSAVEGISVAGGTGGNVGQDQYSPVHVQVKVDTRSVTTASTTAQRYGNTPIHNGAQ
jgi:hypothetical protein